MFWCEEVCSKVKVFFYYLLVLDYSPNVELYHDNKLIINFFDLLLIDVIHSYSLSASMRSLVLFAVHYEVI